MVRKMLWHALRRSDLRSWRESTKTGSLRASPCAPTAVHTRPRTPCAPPEFTPFAGGFSSSETTKTGGTRLFFASSSSARGTPITSLLIGVILREAFDNCKDRAIYLTHIARVLSNKPMVAFRIITIPPQITILLACVANTLDRGCCCAPNYYSATDSS